MKAVVYEHPLEFSVRQVKEPRPDPKQVRLKVRVTGVCGTDLHLHRGEFFPVYPLIPGHEIVGVVDTLGDDVEGLSVGETVVVDNIRFCGACHACRSHKTNLCESLSALGVTHPGGFAEYVIADAAKCYVVDDLNIDEAVLAEPTSCAMHGLDILGLTPGSEVLLIGAGPSGMILTQLLASSGASRITVAGPTPFKLDIARELGADDTVQIQRERPDQNERRLRDHSPDGYDAVVDATGAVGVLALSVKLVRDGGSILVYGMAGEEDVWSISPYDVFRRELSIKGSFAQAYSFQRGLVALRSGRVRADGIITHRFGLDQYGEALAAVEQDPMCLKALIGV